VTAGDAHATLCQTGGDLERIRRIGRLEGYIHCAPGFRDHPKVLDGVSDLLLKVFEARQTCAHRLGDSGQAVKRLHPTRRLGRSVRLEAPGRGGLLGSAPKPCWVALARQRAVPETTSCPE